jgi:hypothetical protein
VPSPTLVIADYPVGYASGFGETLFNLFSGFPDDRLWSAHPGHLAAADEKKKGQSVNLASPSRPSLIPSRLSLTYYPFLKVEQRWAAKRALQTIRRVVDAHAIKNLLVIPVTPWILSAALSVHKSCPQLNMILFVMDDWQGHHECHHLPYSKGRRRLLTEAVERASTRFAVSREMAAHYESVYGNTWCVAHNGISRKSIQQTVNHSGRKKQVLLAGDINEFRLDAVKSFAEAINRHNGRNGNRIDLVVMGDVAEKHRRSLSGIGAISFLGRQPHRACLSAMQEADLLYLPLAFNKSASRISRYSLPTKLPEYLATGKEVLFHAPSESALFQVAERYDLKPRVSSTDAAALDTFIESWQRGNENVETRLSKARRALLQEFDIDVLSSSFQASFN